MEMVLVQQFLVGTVTPSFMHIFPFMSRQGQLKGLPAEGHAKIAHSVKETLVYPPPLSVCVFFLTHFKAVSSVWTYTEPLN